MKIFSFSNFRHRLLLLVLLAAIPALGLMLYTATEQRQQAATNAQEEALRLVRLASNNHEHLIKETEQLLSVIAQLPEVRGESYDSCFALFSRLQKKYPLYACFGIIQPDGKLRCAVPATGGQINLSDRPYFQRVLKTRDFAVGDYRISRVTGKASIHFAYPVMNESGMVKSVLFAELNMDWLNKLAVEADFPPGVTLTVIDRNGTVLSRHPDAGKWVGRAMPEVAIIKNVLNKKAEGTAESTGMDGIPRFYAYRPLSGSAEGGDMYIYTGMPTAKVYAGANRLLDRNLAGIGLITLLLFTIAWFGGNLFFLRGVKALLATTDRLANGDLSARTGISYGTGELCQLAHNFDNMAAALELRTDQLYLAEVKYRTLVEEIPAVTYVIGLDDVKITQYVSPQIKELLGFAPEELVNKPDFRFQQIYNGEFLNALAVINTGCNVGETFHFEYPLLAKDGRVVWVHDEARVIWDESAQHRLLQGFLLDITNRKQAEERICRVAARAEALAELLQAMAEAGLNYNGVLETVARRTAILVGDACVICLLSDEGQWLKPIAYYHQNQVNFNLMRQVFNTTERHPLDMPLSSIIQEGKSLLIPVVEPEQARSIIMPEYHRYLDQCGIHSLLIVPLRVQGGVIGFLGLSRDNPGSPYNEDDHFFTQDLADRVALAITNARLYDENLRQLKRLSALYTGAEKLVQSLDLRELAGDVTRTCVEFFGVSLAYLGRVEADGSLCLLNHYPPESDFPYRVSVRQDSLSPGQGPTHRAIQSRLPVIVNDVIKDPILEQWREIVLAEGLSTCAAFPLINRERSFGTLNLCSDQDGYFTPERVEFFQAFTHMVAATLENARLFEEAGRRLKHVEALRNIDMAITSSLDLRVTFNVVMDQVISQLGIDAAVILLFNPYAQTLEYAAGRGFHTRDVERTCRRLGEGNAGRAAQERRIVHIPNLKEAGDTFIRSYIPVVEGFISYYSVPLIAKGQVKGVLEIFQRNQFNPDQEWLDFLETLAGQAAIAIDNAGLFNDLQRSNDELRLAYDATIEGWSYALDLRDKETEGHSRRVTEVTLRLARAMGVSEPDLVHVRRGALLHDIGKMGVPDHILLKPGPLTDEEWEIMRRHPVYAFEMLSPINYLHSALGIPYCHHEKWDGSGYPRGLKGVQIPLAARIFAVIDVWDALCSDRPYRPAWPEAKACELIQEQSGKHFDPQVVEGFLAMENCR